MQLPKVIQQENRGKSWKSRKIMDNHGKTWKNHGKTWKLMKIMENHGYIIAYGISTFRALYCDLYVHYKTQAIQYLIRQSNVIL